MQTTPQGALRPIDGWAALLVVLCCACWGLNQVAVKVANTGIPPMLQAGLRSLLSAVLVWGWTLGRGIPLFRRDGTLLAGSVRDRCQRHHAGRRCHTGAEVGSVAFRLPHVDDLSRLG